MTLRWRRAIVAGYILAAASDASTTNRLQLRPDAITQHRQQQPLSTPPRTLEYNYDESSAAYPFDISEYSIRFTKCQYVKTYSDEIAQSADYYSIFAMQHFVVYRLCPSSSCSSCDSSYGEYVLEVDDYLQALAQHQVQAFKNMCNDCDEQCSEDGETCDGGSEGCGHECWKYANLEAHGYADATNFVQCQKLNNYDDENNSQLQLYIGPRCSSDGSRVFIGLFTDANCWEPYKTKTVEEVAGFKISYHLLKNTYSSHGADCMSCKESNYNNNNNDNKEDQRDAQDEDYVNEMCEKTYAASAKCESIHGIKSGYIETYKDTYENQVANEYDVCTFINSLVWSSYTETGDINIYDEQNVVLRQVSLNQLKALGTLSVAVVATLGYIAVLMNQIKTVSSSVDLSTQTVGADIS